MEDTEFNDALRAHGIIPKLPTPERTPSPPPAPSTLDRLNALPVNRAPSPDLFDQLEAEISTTTLDDIEQQRKAQLASWEKKQKRFGEVRAINKKEYNREVVDASKIDEDGVEVDEEGGGKGTRVVCYLYKDYLPHCRLLTSHLNRLATLFPSTKFLSIVADQCIPNYPDRAVPTMLVYWKGELQKQIVGLGSDNDKQGVLRGMNTTLEDLELVLIAAEALDPTLRLHPPSGSKSKFNGDEEEEDEDSDFERRDAASRKRLRSGFLPDPGLDDE